MILRKLATNFSFAHHFSHLPVTETNIAPEKMSFRRENHLQSPTFQVRSVYLSAGIVPFFWVISARNQRSLVPSKSKGKLKDEKIRVDGTDPLTKMEVLSGFCQVNKSVLSCWSCWTMKEQQLGENPSIMLRYFELGPGLASRKQFQNWPTILLGYLCGIGYQCF